MKKIYIILIFFLSFSLNYSDSAFAQKVNEGFGGSAFPPLGWTYTDLSAASAASSNIVIRDASTNAYGSLSNVGSIYADYYNYDTGYATLETRTFTSSVSGDSLRFDVAYAAYGSPYIDSFAVLAYIGSSYTYLREWRSSYLPDSGMTTVAATSSQFTPSSTQWRTKVIALPVGTTRIEFKFMTGYGNELYVDNIVVDSYFVSTQTFDSVTCIQTFNTLFTQGSQNQVVMQIPVKVTGQLSPMSVTNFLLSTTGTTSPTLALDTAKIYFTGTNSSFSTANRFGYALSPNGTFSVSGSQVLSNGFNYFWLTYNIKSTAPVASSVDAQCFTATVGGITRVPNVTSPAGSFQVAQLYTFDTLTNQNFTTVVLGGTVPNEWQRGTPSVVGPSSAYTLPNCWATNISGNYTLSSSSTGNYALVSPLFIASATSVSVSYKEWYSFGPVDNGTFEYKVNSGTWTTLGAVITNNSGNAWKEKVNSVALNVNDSIQFRWNFSSLWYSTAAPGWYIDNFAILYLTPIDLLPPNISYAPLSNTSSFTNRTVSNFAAIADDLYSIDTSASYKPRFYYKKKSENNTFGANNSSYNGWKYVSATNGTSPFSFVIDYSLLTSSPIAGDTLQYFVTAEDLSPNHNTGASPSAGFAGSYVSSITSAPSTPGSFIFTSNPPLSGSYNIGSAQTYTSITQAINDLNLRGVSGPVTFILTDTLYSTAETFPITINTFGNASSTNYVTLKPTQTVTNITGSSATSILLFNGVKYFTINGAVSGNTKNLIISNTNTGTVSTVTIASGGIGLGASNDTIRNCIIKGAGNYTNNLAINIGNATFIGSGSASISPSASQSPDNANISLINNQICKAKIGLGISGTSTNKATNILISNNLFGSTTASDYLTWGGAMIANASNVNFTQNTIQNIISSNTDQKAVFGASGISSSSFTKNIIDSMFYSGTGGYGVMGFHFQSASNISVSNNMISRLWADGWFPASSTDAVAGIKIESGSGYSIYYNTVNITGSYNGYSGATIGSAIYIGSTAGNLDIRNNIFSNSFVNTNSLATSAVSYAFNTDASSFLNLNYNNYFVGGTQGILAYANSSSQSTLALLRTALGKDVNSVNTQAFFNSNSDLHLTGTSVGNVTLGCSPTGGITTDIDNQTRFATWHYMGADEVTTSPLPVKMLSFSGSKNNSDAILKWTTSSEINNNYFSIERSMNGNDFSEIAKINGNGNSNRLISYRYTDANAEQISNYGIAYYRLVQVDFDGRKTPSDIVSVDFSGKKISHIISYPNPFTSELSLTFNASENGTAKFSVLDISGRSVFEKTVPIQKGNQTIIVNELDKIETGIYFLSVKMNGENSIIKLIKN